MKLDEKAIKWIIREKKKGTPTKLIAKIENITPQRINQIYKQYKETGGILKLKKPGRSKKELSNNEIKAIKKHTKNIGAMQQFSKQFRKKAIT
ncbi:hypothetical protein Asulf_01854 [Archaeoglobus sulfaticallidus PM70-1]|uniref:Uncharacterized protein n=1 Tax=Archaeoglobus sulfaticallidus PM70-1 TaxID=387631 RepID=N0BH20_9EURY|nr:hypothetical protein Asulf_01596 [Archaeoglobus sulfaticallidus PM70-1]AGK61822.1 hypothetical protein Asulf_01854 [Archaeoglobus sulfaticallidus PM70-1]